MNTDTQPQPTSDTQPQRQQTPPIFDERQKVHVNKIIDKHTARLEAKHREEMAALRAQLDKANGGTVTESDELKRLRAERDEARAEATRVQQEKRRTQVKAEYRDAWRSAGLVDNRDAMNDFFDPHFIQLDDEGQPLIIDPATGKPRYGVTLEDYVRELKDKYPGLSVTGDSSAPASNPRNPSGIRYKSDFADSKAKSDYITKFGYDAWANLPATRPANTGKPEDDPLNWDNARRGDYIREHGSDALAQRLAESRARKRKNGY